MAATPVGYARPVHVEGIVSFGNSPGTSKPRRVTAQHMVELKARLEATAQAFFEQVDRVRPYGIDEVHFRVTYSAVMVDTDDMEEFEDEVDAEVAG